MALAAEDKNRAVELLMVTWIECTISMICVALRFYTRIKITRNVWYDDWVILFTMVCFPLDPVWCCLNPRES